MTKNNAYLSTNDCRQIILYTAAEAIEMFGEEHLAEYGVELPEELIAKYTQNEKERQEIQRQLLVKKLESER